MLKLQLDPMSYTPPKSPSQVSIRVDNSYKRKAEGIRRCWAEIAKAKGEDVVTKDDGSTEKIETEIAHVWRSLLEAKLDEEVSTLTEGEGFPQLEDKAAWAEVLKRISAGITKSKHSKP